MQEIPPEQFNKLHPPGTLVRYWPGIREDGPGTLSLTRSAAWLVGKRTVVAVEGYAGGIALSHVDPVNDAICCYVIYERPDDYPQEFIIRRHYAADGQTHAARQIFGRGTTLDYVRTLLPAGLRNIGRFQSDAAVIREVWI